MIRGNALKLPLPDESVDLIVSSPPYFSLRTYEDDGEHYEGQIGVEATPADFLKALWAVSDECWRVLKPGGSMWINLGDKYAGSGSHNNAGIASERKRKMATAKRYNQASDVRKKSVMGLPWRFALGLATPDPYRTCYEPDQCGEHPQWINRRPHVWRKLNGIPESVSDRSRMDFEDWFHFTKEGEYFSAVDEIRMPHAAASIARATRSREAERNPAPGLMPPQNLHSDQMNHPLGRLPGSVWDIATEGLDVPDYLVDDGWGVQLLYAKELWDLATIKHRDGVKELRVREIDHYAAFPREWPRRLILGYAPTQGICTACDEPRRPVIDKRLAEIKTRGARDSGRRSANEPKGNSRGINGAGVEGRTEVSILGYACSCTPVTTETYTVASKKISKRRDKDPRHIGYEDRPKESVRLRKVYKLEGWKPPPTRPAVILDPFGGTGTVALVARALGCTGISVDLSMDYSRLAHWRVFQSDAAKKVLTKTWGERQGGLAL